MNVETTIDGAAGPLVPVLHVGPGITHYTREFLREHGIGLIVCDDATRAVRLLTQFRVAAVIYALPDLQWLPGFVRTDTPVVLLSDSKSPRILGGGAVAVIDPDGGLATLAETIRSLATRERLRLSPSRADDEPLFQTAAGTRLARRESETQRA